MPRKLDSNATIGDNQNGVASVVDNVLHRPAKSIADHDRRFLSSPVFLPAWVNLVTSDEMKSFELYYVERMVGLERWKLTCLCLAPSISAF